MNHHIYIIAILIVINSIRVESTPKTTLTNFDMDNLNIENTKEQYYECIIQNNHEYMATLNQFESLPDSKRQSRKVYTIPLNQLSSMDQQTTPSIKWKLIPVNQQNDTFFIIDMNHDNDEFLCGSKQHLDFFKLRRKVNTIIFFKLKS